MKVAVMQPYFFPYIAYWQLYYYVDLWVILDEVQFRKFSWMRRNKILHDDRSKETQYINLPVKKHKQKIPINEVRVNNDVPWREDIRSRVRVYERLKAEHYREVAGLLNNIIDRNNSGLVDVMVNTFAILNSYLGMETKHVCSSMLDFNRNDVRAPDEWALRITKALGGNAYINLPGGKELYHGDKFRSNGIELFFLNPEFREYSQSSKPFKPGLSILDVLMFNTVEVVREMLGSDFMLGSACMTGRKTGSLEK
jgi:hypothetical protein